MRLASTSSPHAVSLTDKETKLKSFIAEAFAQRAAAPDTLAVEPVTLVARSAESPIVRALSSAVEDAGPDAPAIRIVFLNPTLIENTASILLDVNGASFRVLHDARFGAAHEQLVLTPDRVWIGDCMRRDPNKRDAFEIYHGANTAARNHAAVSFTRLWSIATTCKTAPVQSLAPEVIVAGQAADAVSVNPSQRR